MPLFLSSLSHFSAQNSCWKVAWSGPGLTTSGPTFRNARHLIPIDSVHSGEEQGFSARGSRFGQPVIGSTDRRPPWNAKAQPSLAGGFSELRLGKREGRKDTDGVAWSPPATSCRYGHFLSWKQESFVEIGSINPPRS